MIAYSAYKKSNGSYSVKYKHGGEFIEANLTRTQATLLCDELNKASKANRLASGYAK